MSAIKLQSEQMTSPEMDFITSVAWEPQASQSESNPVLQENITARFSVTSQDLDSVMWNMEDMENESAVIMYCKANFNELNVILRSH